MATLSAGSSVTFPIEVDQILTFTSQTASGRAVLSAQKGGDVVYAFTNESFNNTPIFAPGSQGVVTLTSTTNPITYSVSNSRFPSYATDSSGNVTGLVGPGGGVIGGVMAKAKRILKRAALDNLFDNAAMVSPPTITDLAAAPSLTGYTLYNIATLLDPVNVPFLPIGGAPKSQSANNYQLVAEYVSIGNAAGNDQQMAAAIEFMTDSPNLIFAGYTNQAYANQYRIAINGKYTSASNSLTQAIGTGNAATVTFTGTLSGFPIAPSSIVITAGTVVAQDSATNANVTTGTLVGTGITSGTINYQTGAYSITYTAAPANGLAITSTYGALRLTGNPGGSWWIQLTGLTGINRVRIEWDRAVLIQKFYTLAPFTMWRPNDEDYVNACFYGDSYFALGSPSTFQHMNTAAICAQKLGWRYTQAATGGTGYLQTSGNFTFGDANRLNDLTRQTFDVVVVLGSVNDAGFTTAQIQAAALACWQGMRIKCPTQPIIIFGVPQNLTIASATAIADENALAAAFAAWGDSNSYFIRLVTDSTQGAWTTLTGSAINYTAPDNVHTNLIGSNYFGTRMANAIKSIINASPTF